MSIRLLLAVWLCLIGASGCRSNPAPIQHIVLIKLQDPGATEDLLRDGEDQLRTIPTIASYHAGTHIDIGRGNVDSDYDACFTIGFNDVEAYREYLDHPIHVALVEEWSERWSWIRIYDVSSGSH